MIFALTAMGAPVEAELNGDIKSFFTVTVPYEHVLMPEHPSGQGVLDNRMKLVVRWESLELTAHHTTTALTGSSLPPGLGSSTGVGLQAPELVDLSWVAFDEDLTLRGRVDRLALKWSPPGLDVTVGRQAITFGSAYFFTPLDLVNPFNPAVIDQEYKPGVDALRADVYAGFASRLTLAAAYAGPDGLEGMILAAYGQSTVGVTDIGLFAGSVRGDGVFGASVVTSVGAIGLTSDLTFTLPATDEDPFFRGTLGTIWRPGANTTVTAEVYVQTLGATDPDDYAGELSGPRTGTGEIWLAGVGYAGIALSQQVRPTLAANVALIGNVLDPSALVAPNVSWSVDDNVEFAVGGFIGVGARPDDLELTDLIGPTGPLRPEELTYLNSEFGTYPAAVFAQTRLYF